MRAVLFLALLMSQFSIAVAGQNVTSENVREWLSRVSSVGKTLNYEGTFIYRHGNKMEAIRVIHKADEKGEHERLVSLTGVAREIIRNNDQVTCILPKNRSVVVDNVGPETKLPTFPSDLANIEGYYDFVFEGYERVASRQARRVLIRPKDSLRYGYRVWIDDAFELLLRSELLDTGGNVVEQIMFTSIKLHQTIDEALLKPNISGREYKWVTDDEKRSDDPMAVDASWQANDLPKGFMKSHHNMQKLPDNKMPVEHLVFTDGLAWVSVYIEKLDKQKQLLDGTSNMGAVNAFGRIVGDYQITAVGEVPEATVQLLGRSIEHIRIQ